MYKYMALCFVWCAYLCSAQEVALIQLQKQLDMIEQIYARSPDVAWLTFHLKRIRNLINEAENENTTGAFAQLVGNYSIKTIYDFFDGEDREIFDRILFQNFATSAKNVREEAVALEKSVIELLSLVKKSRPKKTKL